ncbi:MAG: bifunctional pyr operon transcriptional regulator/uracil phosphoribosyltransferase PyrR [Candidatus Margulisiibacteriota bacterium]|jgi:pyrimidine operon attenuation protein/uracil phosphoribosyltransferase
MDVKAVVMEDKDIHRAVKRIAHEIIETTGKLDTLILIGIISRGAQLAERLAREIKKAEKVVVPVGQIDISLYRDDLSTKGNLITIKETRIPCDITDKHVVLVDDVLFHGRTIRAAMDGLNDYGRPKTIRLAVLIDRGHRELPIHADFIGKSVPTSKYELVEVKLLETDGDDTVVIK